MDKNKLNFYLTAALINLHHKLFNTNDSLVIESSALVPGTLYLLKLFNIQNLYIRFRDSNFIDLILNIHEIRCMNTGSSE